jgi:hypothetical protein
MKVQRKIDSLFCATPINAIMITVVTGIIIYRAIFALNDFQNMLPKPDRYIRVYI